MNNCTILAGLIGLIIAVIAFVEARSFPIQSLENGLGAGFFPLLVIFALATVSLVSLFKGVLARNEDQESLAGGKREVLWIWIAGFLILFTIAFSHFGLIAPTIIFISAASYKMGAPLKNAVFTGVVAGSAVYVLFVNILNVQLI